MAEIDALYARYYLLIGEKETAGYLGQRLWMSSSASEWAKNGLNFANY
jgi:hypothetical protein